MRRFILADTVTLHGAQCRRQRWTVWCCMANLHCPGVLQVVACDRAAARFRVGLMRNVLVRQDIRKQSIRLSCFTHILPASRPMHMSNTHHQVLLRHLQHVCTCTEQRLRGLHNKGVTNHDALRKDLEPNRTACKTSCTQPVLCLRLCVLSQCSSRRQIVCWRSGYCHTIDMVSSASAARLEDRSSYRRGLLPSRLQSEQSLDNLSFVRCLS